MKIQFLLSDPGARKVSTGDLAAQIAKQREDANTKAATRGGINRSSKRTAEKRAKKLRRIANVNARAELNREFGGERGSKNVTAFHAKMVSIASGKGGAI